MANRLCLPPPCCTLTQPADGAPLCLGLSQLQPDSPSKTARRKALCPTLSSFISPGYFLPSAAASASLLEFKSESVCRRVGLIIRRKAPRKELQDRGADPWRRSGGGRGSSPGSDRPVGLCER